MAVAREVPTKAPRTSLADCYQATEIEMSTPMNTLKTRVSLRKAIVTVAVLATGLPLAATPAHAVALAGSISGEIERITLNAPGDVYAGGQMVVGGQNVIIPRNLLLDLPANRLTLQQLFAQAPAECITNHETGLAKTDRCNHTGVGGTASLSANRVATGDLIVGDALIEKGAELVQGNVTYIDFNGGWFIVNGRQGDPTTGTMVRLNDPTSRHTLQSGPGCAAGSSNCSADPRFGLDTDNYTNAFTSGYPLCIPSTVTTGRATTSVITGLLTNAGANATTGAGDQFCPTTNRVSPSGLPLRIAADSRRMAPIMLGDSITVGGNYETIGGVHFLSAFRSSISYGLQTSAGAGQPDYMFINEAGIDVAGFQNQRVRGLFIGFATLPTPDVLSWSVHYDPVQNKAHEMPLASTQGCNTAGGIGTCTGFGIGLFRIRYDSDFIKQPTAAKLSPCLQLRADPLFANACPDPANMAAQEFAILSPIPHEIHFRTRKKVNDTTNSLKSIDIKGTESTNGQYLFPFGANLGGISFPEGLEFNLDAANAPFSFEGIPWNLDRRLSPGGCQATGGVCESTPQPLIPFPYSELDPRTQAAGAIAPGGAVPSNRYNDPMFTSAQLSNAQDRILSYIPNDTATAFAGDASVLALPTAAAVSQGITPTPSLTEPSPTLLGFDPSSGQVGTMVHVGGLGLDTATAVTVNGTAAMFSVISATRLDVLVPIGATVGAGSIVVTLPSGNLTSVAQFTVITNPLAPTITGFTPATGDTGSVVTINGTNFAGATAVSFGGISAAASVNPAGTQITTNIPLAATAGPVNVSVITPNGTVVAATQLTVTVPPPPPPAPAAITSINPTSSSVGTVVTITGTGFLGATQVSFNGTTTPATVVNSTTITATVPVGATTGTVTIISPNGTGAGKAFTVAAAATPTAVVTTPVSAAQSSLVTLNASASTNAASFAWTQLTGPTVVLTGATTARPSFTMPALFQTLTFRVTVTNQALTSTATVTVTALPGSVTITAATPQYRISKAEWRAAGTASFPGANIVTIRTGNVVGSGTLVGTVAVSTAGTWTLQVINPSIPVNTAINVVASRGGSATATVTVRN